MKRNHSVRPRFVAPMLSKRIQTLPKRDTWFYEVHRPGHRALVVKEAANVKLYSPSGNALDCPEVMSAVRKLDARCAVLDCQLIALDVRGQCRFEPLGPKRNNHTVHLCAFDLLHLNGRDLTSEPQTATLHDHAGYRGDLLALAGLRSRYADRTSGPAFARRNYRQTAGFDLRGRNPRR